MAVYETRPAEQLAVPAARLAQADFITFTSGSTAHQFVALMKAAGVALDRIGAVGATAGVSFVSIGPQTSEALVGHGLEVAAEADPHTGEGLVRAIATLAAGDIHR